MCNLNSNFLKIVKTDPILSKHDFKDITEKRVSVMKDHEKKKKKKYFHQSNDPYQNLPMNHVFESICISFFTRFKVMVEYFARERKNKHARVNKQYHFLKQ